MPSALAMDWDEEEAPGDRDSGVREPSRRWEGEMVAAGVLVSENETEAKVLRRISRRFLWFLFILLVINFLDRVGVQVVFN